MEYRNVFVAAIWSALFLACSAANCSMSDADEAATKLIIFARPDFKVPLDSKGIDDFCKEAFTALTSVKGYIKECTTGIPKSMGGVMMSSIEKLLKDQLCNSEEGRQTFLKHAPCLNEHTPQILSCVSNLGRDLELSGKQYPERHLDYACCASIELLTCVKNSVKACSEETSAIVSEFTTGILSNLVDAVCVTYQDDPESCEELEPIDRTQKVENLSVLPSLIRLGENFLG